MPTRIADRERLEGRGLRCHRNRVERDGLHARFRGRHVCESESRVAAKPRNPANEMRFPASREAGDNAPALAPCRGGRSRQSLAKEARSGNAGAMHRDEVSLAARSPLAGPPSHGSFLLLRRGRAVALAEAEQISLGGPIRPPPSGSPLWPPFDLSAKNPRRLGRTLATRDTSPRSAPARGPLSDAWRSVTWPVPVSG